jgi:hypothetical protein
MSSLFGEPALTNSITRMIEVVEMLYEDKLARAFLCLVPILGQLLYLGLLAYNRGFDKVYVLRT